MTTTLPSSAASTSAVPPPAPATSHPLSSQTFKRLHPQAYLERYISEGYRPDGRKLGGGTESWREVSVNPGSVSTASGSSLVRIGETTIVCGIKAEIFEPELYRPNQGCLVPNIDLPSLCSSKFKPGPPSTEAQVLTDRLSRVLSHPSILPLTSLCIEPGKAAWVLYIDAVCINYDGNSWDACLLAVVAALRNTKLPAARWDETNERTICSRTAPAVPLSLGEFLPISTTFGVLSSKTLLSDPTAFEEPLLSSTITVVYLVFTTSSAGAGASKMMFLEQTGLGGLVAGPGGGVGAGTAEVLGGVVKRGRERVEGVLKGCLGV